MAQVKKEDMVSYITAGVGKEEGLYFLRSPVLCGKWCSVMGIWYPFILPHVRDRFPNSKFYSVWKLRRRLVKMTG